MQIQRPSPSQFIYPFAAPAFQQHLHSLGLTLIAVSVLYLVAANWFMLAKPMQLAIPQLLLLLSSIGSMMLHQHTAIRQTLNTVAGLMIGLSLAVIGQIYQTGADSFLLFTVWALLLLPWLYRPNIGIFALFAVVSNLALMLFFQQTFLRQASPYLFILILNLWLFLLSTYCLKFYPALRYIFLAVIAAQSLWCIFQVWTQKDYVFLIFAFILPLLAFVYFNHKKEALSMSLSAAIIGIITTAWLVFELAHSVDNELTMLLLSSILIFICFASLSFFIIKLLPEGKFHSIPLAIGAWFSGFILAAIMLIFWDKISFILGLGFMVIGFVILQKQHGHFFVRQLAYCLMISGQIAFLMHLVILSDTIWISFIAQMLITAVIYTFKPHWIFLCVQLITLYGLGIASMSFSLGYQIGETFLHQNIWLYYGFNYLFFSLLLIKSLIQSNLQRAFFITAFIVIISSAFLDRLFLSLPSDFNLMWLNLLILFPTVWFIALLNTHLKTQLTPLALISITIFTAVLIYFGFFEILILLLILSWAIQQNDRLIYALSLICLTVVLWYLYYNLYLPFLIKSLSIFISGLMLMIVGFILSQQLKISTQELKP